MLLIRCSVGVFMLLERPRGRAGVFVFVLLKRGRDGVYC